MILRRRFLIGAIVLAVLLFVVLNMTFNSTDSTAVFQDKENVSIAVTGDVMFARNMPNVLSLDSSPFEGVSDVTSNVDLLLINFENAATTSGDALKGDVPLKCDPSYVPLAKANNNTVASFPVNASPTNITKSGFETLLIFFISSIRLVLVCILPAVSIKTSSFP